VILDDIISAPEFSERHARRIAAEPDRVWAALLELRLSDSPVARLLMAVRTLGPLRRGRHEQLISGRFLDHGPVPLLAITPGECVVAGGVMQPWKLGGGAEPPLLDAAALRAFDRAGWVKCAVDFVLVPDGAGTQLTTETRVAATDTRSRRCFALYWLLIRAGSGLIRREMLRVVARHAETA
jgi:hypothetical protein